MYSHIPKLTKRIHEAFAASSATMKAAHGTRPMHAGAIRDAGATPHGAAYSGLFGATYAGPHVMLSPEEQRVVEELDRLVGADTSIRANQVRRWPDRGTPEHQPHKAFEDRYQGRQPKTSFDEGPRATGFLSQDNLPEFSNWFQDPSILIPNKSVLTGSDERWSEFEAIVRSFVGRSEAEMYGIIDEWPARGGGATPEILALAQQTIPEIIAWRNQDPAWAFEVEVLDIDDRRIAISEAARRYGRLDSLEWQAHAGVTDANRRVLTEQHAAAIWHQMKEMHRHAERDGELADYRAMVVSMATIRRLFGEELTSRVAMEAITQSGTRRLRDHFTTLANWVLEHTGQVPRSETVEHTRLSGTMMDVDRSIERAFDEARDRLVDYPRSISALKDILGSGTNLLVSSARGVTNVAADGLGGVATLQAELSLAAQERFVERLRSAQELSGLERFYLESQVAQLEAFDPEVGILARNSLNQVLDGTLSPDEVTVETLFGQVADPAELALVAASQSIREWGDETFESSPYWEDHVTSALGEALGENAPAFLLALNGPARVARIAAGGVLEVAGVRGNVLQQAMDAGVPPQQIYDAVNLATWAGAAGVIDVEFLIRFPKLQNVVTDVLLDAAEHGILDAGQAGVQQILENLAVRLFDEGRGVFDGVPQSAATALLSSQAQRQINQIIDRHYPVGSDADPDSGTHGVRPTDPDDPTSPGGDGATEQLADQSWPDYGTPPPVTNPTERQLARSQEIGLDPRWLDGDGEEIWPEGNGFAQRPEVVTLPVGTRFDRYGGIIDEENGQFRDTGRYASPPEVQFGERALPEYRRFNDEHREYEVIRSIESVMVGPSIPWFDQPGGGIQYFLPKGIDDLRSEQFIVRVPNTGGSHGNPEASD